MPGFNVTVQQYTPLIRYSPPGAWVPGSPTGDSEFQRYDDGFMLTTANAATATFEFNGTGVWIYGAYRLNHGNFSVSVDGTQQGVFNGSAIDFQVLLFGAGGLENRKHTVELTNIPLSTDHQYVDIDYITYEMQLDQKSLENTVQQVDVSSGNWTYDNSWSLEGSSTQDKLLTSTTSGAKTTLTFQGENVEVYGSIGALFSQFDVTIDGGTTDTVDCHNDESRPSVLLWSANSLGDWLHKLEITNRPNSTSQNKLGLDYARVRSATKGTVLSGTTVPSITASAAPTGSNSPTDDGASKTNTGAIVGGVIGAVVFLVVVAIAVFHWQRKKRLANRPSSSYIPPMSNNREILPVTNPSVGSGLQGSHPKYGPPVQATTANPATYSNIPPEHRPTINNHLSSNESNLSTALGSGSLLSASTAASSNAMSSQSMSLPASSYPRDVKAVYQPREQSAHPLSHLSPPEPPTQPSLSSHRQTMTTVQSHPTSASTYLSGYTAYSTGSAGVNSSYTHQPHAQSFGDQNEIPDRSGSHGGVQSPPPDYWSSAGQSIR